MIVETLCMYKRLYDLVAVGGKHMTDEEISKKLRIRDLKVFEYIMVNYNL